jgi:hypothetical protein
VLSYNVFGPRGLLQAEEAGPTVPHMCTIDSHWADRQGELCTHSLTKPTYQVYRGRSIEYKELRGGFNMYVMLDDCCWGKLLQIPYKLNTFVTFSYT